MSKLNLVIDPSRKYSYEYLSKFFGGEENMSGVDTPEIVLNLGNRQVNIVFEASRVEIGADSYIRLPDNSYRLVEIVSYPIN